MPTRIEAPAKTDSRQEQLIDHLRKGRTVCPYATEAAVRNIIQYCNLPDIPPDDPEFFRTICTALLKFLDNEDQMGLIFLLPTDPVNHYDGILDANRIFIELLVAARFLHTRETNTEARRAVFAEHGHALNEPCNILTPRLETFNGGCFLFAMNQLYNKEHPRFSPVPIVVVTRGNDLALAFALDQRKVRNIALAARRRLITAILPEEERQHVSIGIADDGDPDGKFKVVHNLQPTTPKHLIPALQRALGKYGGNFYELPLQ